MYATRENWTERAGTIPGAFHAPRDKLEFWVDPYSPYSNPIHQEGQRLVRFCKSSWRSALAVETPQNIGLAPVAHLERECRRWKESNGETVSRNGSRDTGARKSLHVPSSSEHSTTSGCAVLRAELPR